MAPSYFRFSLAGCDDCVSWFCKRFLKVNLIYRWEATFLGVTSWRSFSEVWQGSILYCDSISSHVSVFWHRTGWETHWPPFIGIPVKCFKSRQIDSLCSPLSGIPSMWTWPSLWGHWRDLNVERLNGAKHAKHPSWAHLEKEVGFWSRSGFRTENGIRASSPFSLHGTHCQTFTEWT